MLNVNSALVVRMDLQQTHTSFVVREEASDEFTLLGVDLVVEDELSVELELPDASCTVSTIGIR